MPHRKSAVSSAREIIRADPKMHADPDLPNVLLIGDSISMAYAPVVAERLPGEANVYRVSGNVGSTISGVLRLDTSNAVHKIDGWLHAKPWSVIHFNWGLHDIKLDAKDRYQVPLADYKKNLRVLVKKLKESGAKLIWASTTPVPPGHLSPRRRRGDEEIYNASALRIMEASGIAINDLHAFITPHLAKAQQPHNVHFTADGSTLLGDEVAAKVREALTARDEAAK